MKVDILLQVIRSISFYLKTRKKLAGLQDDSLKSFNTLDLSSSGIGKI